MQAREVVLGAGRHQDQPDDGDVQHGARHRGAVLGHVCTWELENWGGGWIFAPDYYPSGEELFQTGARSNSGQLLRPDRRTR